MTTIANNIFYSIKNDLDSVKSQISKTQGSRAEETINNYMSISDNLSHLGTLKTDSLCNKQINQLTGGGAEDGFSINPKLLSDRVELFIGIYLKAKEQGDLKGFFSCFSNGDPCLSGRTESLYKYAANLEKLEVDSMPDPEKSLFLPGTVFSEIIMNRFEEGTTEEEFSNYVKDHVSEIAPLFNNQESKVTAAFLEFLEAAKIYIPSEKVNWESLLLKLLPTSFFKTVYQQSLRYVI